MSQPLILNLQTEAAAIDAFAQALKEERQAIREGDFLRLNELLEHKTELADTLARLAAVREAQMGALGIRIGTDRQPSGRAVTPEVSAAWNALMRAARLASEATELAGAIVAAHLDYTNEALTALRQRGNDTTVYGRDGRPQPGQQGVSLANG